MDETATGDGSVAPTGDEPVVRSPPLESAENDDRRGSGVGGTDAAVTRGP